MPTSFTRFRQATSPLSLRRAVPGHASPIMRNGCRTGLSPSEAWSPISMVSHATAAGLAFSEFPLARNSPRRLLSGELMWTLWYWSMGVFPHGYLRHVRSLPPLLLIWGSADTTFPLSIGRELQRTVLQLGGPITLDVYEGGAHYFFLRSGTGDAVAAHHNAAEFLAEYLSR